MNLDSFEECFISRQLFHKEFCSTMPELGVNIDHVATVRQARKTYEPDPVWAAALAELGGADQITIHLREDRRHIQERDLIVLKETVTVKLNLEVAAEDAVVEIALRVLPDAICVVPERREEVTTEGGLDVAGQKQKMQRVVSQLKAAGMFVSMFVDADQAQVLASAEIGADAVELHTGSYALAKGDAQIKELEKLALAGQIAQQAGLRLHAGHGLTYRNVLPVAAIAGMRELNIGHSIVARALMVGFQQAVREMKVLIDPR
jgi:pyridoxine 5-phosphate synthase